MVYTRIMAARLKRSDWKDFYEMEWLDLNILKDYTFIDIPSVERSVVQLLLNLSMLCDALTNVAEVTLYQFLGPGLT